MMIEQVADHDGVPGVHVDRRGAIGLARNLKKNPLNYLRFSFVNANGRARNHREVSIDRVREAPAVPL